MGEGSRNYLDFPSFHKRTVKLLSGPLCISTRLKCYKTEALQANEQRRQKSSNKAEAPKHLWIDFMLIEKEKINLIWFIPWTPFRWKWSPRRGFFQIAERREREKKKDDWMRTEDMSCILPQGVSTVQPRPSGSQPTLLVFSIQASPPLHHSSQAVCAQMLQPKVYNSLKINNCSQAGNVLKVELLH